MFSEVDATGWVYTCEDVARPLSFSTMSTMTLSEGSAGDRERAGLFGGTRGRSSSSDIEVRGRFVGREEVGMARKCSVKSEVRGCKVLA